MSDPGAAPSPSSATDPTIGPSALSDIRALSEHPDQSAARARLIRSGTQGGVPHPTVEERQRRGKAARVETPRQDLGGWQAPADRADPIALLKGQETSRVQELVPVRHARMATSAFAFYRGSAIVMASDLSTRPRTSLDAQLCGDAHLANFGMFAAPDRTVVFDVNDFDETNPGPFEWDVKRLAASIVLAARDNKLSEKVAASCTEAAAAQYRIAMTDFATRREIDIWYDRIDVTSMQTLLQGDATDATKAKQKKKIDKVQGAVDKSLAAARARDQWSAIAKITEVVDGQRQFRNNPPLLTRLDVDPESRAVVNGLFREYRSTLQDDRKELLKRYEIVDIGHKVVGVGSVGLLALVLLMRGRDENDLMVIQVKQAHASVLEPYTHKSAFNKHGHRVVTGQRLMQAASDSFLGWIDGPGGRSFYLRQLRDMKWSPDLATLTPDGLLSYSRLCGHTLARAHARSGDAVAFAAYLGNSTAFDKAISEFAVSYAGQVALDFAAFTAAIASGRMTAHESESVADEAATDALFAPQVD
jgi:uncharacterized protein (DUF2252 family)